MCKRGGSGVSILPRGVTSVEDIPSDLANAIDHGYKILSWQENLQENEMPPRWMWHLDWELEEWFKGVEAARKNPTDDREETVLERNEDPEIAERFGR